MKFNIQTLMQKFSLPILAVSLVLASSCVENSGVRAKASKVGSSLTGDKSGGSSALPDGSGVGTTDPLQSIKVELSHLVDPFDGTYKKKLTIPKNYKGYLYIAGLNVAALSDKFIKVRFNFGVDRQAVVLDATLARAPGIIPQTDIQVLAINMSAKPFSKMSLPYDLYDYNTYAAGDAATTDPRNNGLFCRGLQLDDDPTFDATVSTNGSCDGPGQKCQYAYAKITDATLYNTSNLTAIPSRPQIYTGSGTSRSPNTKVSATSMCLPDVENVATMNILFGQSLGAGFGYGSTFTSGDVVNGTFTGTYKGPYRAINPLGWRIQGSAIFNKQYGIFKNSKSSLYGDYSGTRSFLFPLEGKMDLNAEVRYLGSAVPTAGYAADTAIPRTDESTTSSGETGYVDGCNLRVQHYDVATTEGLGSCNVNGSIEVFYIKDGVEVNITTDKSIKLQLLKPSLTNFEGKEVLASAFKQCDSSSSCGSSECCFNSRCWSKDLVTQCVDQMPIVGNQEVGANCSSDFECSSLCCDQSRQACAPHDPNGAAPVACSKSPGQQCVAKEFCKPQFVETCKIVKLPNNPDGTAACALRCPSVETYGDCVGGYCKPPVIPPVPAFDPKDCSKAVDP